MAQPMVVASINSGTFNSRTVSTGTITSWTPQTNDIVVVLVQMPQAGTVTFTLPSGWANLLGGTTVATSAGGSTMVAVWHTVTQAEATTGTTSWTLTNLLDVSKQGSRLAFVVRGADPASPVDISAAAGGQATGNTMTIPGITPTKNDCLVVAGGGGNSFSTSVTYTAPASPWSTITGTLSGTNIRFAFKNATPTVAGTPVPSTSMAVSNSGDYWTAVIIAFAPAGLSRGNFFAMF